MQIKYCIDAWHFISCIEFGFIDFVTSFDDMTYAQLLEYLDSKAKESKAVVTLDALNELMKKKLKTNMDSRNPKFVM